MSWAAGLLLVWAAVLVAASVWTVVVAVAEWRRAAREAATSAVWSLSDETAAHRFGATLKDPT